MKTFSIDGVLCNESSAVISVTDHGFLYGDGVFEGLRFYGNRVLKLTAHLKRLEESAIAINLQLPMSSPELQTAVTDIVAASKHDDGYLRLVITRGVGPLGIDPRQCKKGKVIIIADQLTMMSPEVKERGANVIIASTRRLAGDQLDSRIKSLNYLNQIMARLEANSAGADEGIMLNQSGYIAEGTADNVFIVKDGQLLTPPVTDGALEGITRGLVMELAAGLSIIVRERSLTLFDLFTADECFLTGTGAELIAVRQVAGRMIKFSPGPVFQSIKKQFQLELQKETFFS
jgi:branched-chain amino acid aminotransferase